MRITVASCVLLFVACAGAPSPPPASPSPRATNAAAPAQRDALSELQVAEKMYERAERTKLTDDYAAAAELFDTVVARGEPRELVSESAYTAALARMAVWNADPASKQEDSSDRDRRDTAPLELPVAAQRMLDAFHVYQQQAPDDPMATTMEFIEGQLDYKYHRVDDALRLLRDIVDHHLEHASAPEAVPLVLDLLVRTHRDLDVRDVVAALRRDTDWLSAHPDVAALLAEIPTH